MTSTQPRLALLLLLVPLLALPVRSSGQEREDTLAQRLKPEQLQEVRRDARRLRNAAMPSPTSGGFTDVRAAIHVHSRLSHDSAGTPEEIAAAAKKAGVRAVLMTEHPTADRKWLTEQVKGEKDGVLFIPGAETSDGLLVFGSQSVQWQPEEKTGPLLEKLLAGGAIGIICHPEKRTDWTLPAFHGMEIYNSHADVEDNRRDAEIFQKGRTAEAMVMLTSFRQYPVEAFAAIFDPPAGNLKRWDELTRQRHVTGVAGNDAHANVGVTAVVEGTKIILKDPLGKTLGDLSQKDIPPFLFGVSSYKQGEKVLDVRFDPYDVSLGYVSTHLLAKRVEEADLLDALKRGRAYVAFDWIADPSGFSFTADSNGRVAAMGDDASVGAKLSARTSLRGTIRLLRAGVEVARAEGKELSAVADQAGAYRIEVSVPVAGQERPWIYSNPIYVR